MGRARTLGAAVAAAACALGAPAAQAAPTDLRLRVEGRSATLYEGTLRTSAAPVDGGDGSGPHDCNAGASAASALAASGLPWAGTWNRDFRDFFLDRVAADASDPRTASYWSVLVGWRYASGVCRGVVPAGGEVLLAYGGASRVLRLDGPARVAVGEPFAVTVRDGWVRASTGLDGGPVAGASVGGATTGADGRATLRFDAGGLRRLKATAPDAIRSNALDVCVGDARCEGALPPPPPARAPAVRLAIDVPAAGERYAPGGATLRLRGRAPGAVALGLAGRRGRRCVGLAPGGRIVRRPCGRMPAAVALAQPAGAWSLALRRRLPAGRYRLVATAGGRTLTRRFAVAAAPATVRAAIERGGRWLRSHRSRSPLLAGWRAIALGRVAPGSRAHRRALARVRAARRRDLGSLERAALALRGGGGGPELRRLQAAIARRQRADGGWRGGVDATAYAVVALRGGRHRAAVRAARAWLRARALGSGGATGGGATGGGDATGGSTTGGSTTGGVATIGGADTIGAVLWALGRRAPRALVARLRSLQNPDGGLPARPGEPSNAQSTALAVIGLEAAGVRARSVRADTGISGVDYLRARQGASGRIRYARRDRRTPVWVTAQALVGLDAVRRGG